MRLFVACLLPAELRQEIAQVKALLGGAGRGIAGLKWVDPENLHVTLKFLGDVKPQDAGRVDAALGGCCGKAVPFDCRVAGLGAFPSSSSLRVLWAGMETGAKEMGALAKSIEDALRPLGFERESRGFSAHITLARARDRVAMPSLETLAPGLPAKVFGEFQVGGFSLMESDLRPHGPVYTELSSYALSGQP